MARRIDDLRDAALLDDASGVHDRDAIGDLDGGADVVGDEDHRHAGLALQFAQEQQNLDLHRRVERRGRLVGEQQARLAGQRQGDHRALAHAARELVGIGVETSPGLRNLHPFKHLQRLRAGACIVDRVMRADRFDDLLTDRIDRVESKAWLLKDHRRGAAAIEFERPSR